MRARVSVLLVLVCLATALIAAQQRSLLVVKVTDTSGSAIPGASITVSGTEQRTCTADVNGECRLPGLAAGRYSMTTELAGFETLVQTFVILAGQDLRVAAVLRLGALTETITVTSSSLMVDGGYLRRDSRNTESYDDVGENPFRLVSATPLSTFSVDVDTASYSNMRRFLNDGELPPDASIRIEELINYFRYSYPQPKADQPFSITTELSECPWNPKHRLALIGLQGRELAAQSLPARNLVFLIDVSGSMMAPDKLPLVQHGLRMLANTLTKDDRVSIVVYAGASGLVLPPTSGDRREEIATAIEGLEAGGSTNGAEGIRLAYQAARESFIKEGVNRVVLATDGDFNVGVTDADELVRIIERERETGVSLSVLGVGTGNLKDSTMEKLADHGNGNYSYLDSPLEAHRVLVKEAGATLITIAKDVKIQAEFNPQSVSAYRLIGYENRMLADEDFNDDRKDAGEIGAGHSVTALYEIVPAGETLARHGVDARKYTQSPAPVPPRMATPRYQGELMTVKLRYKAPEGGKSKPLSVVVRDRMQPMTANLGFASAVAEAGMLLRHSIRAPGASLDAAMERARQFRGDDRDGYRAEFIRLMEIASSMQNSR